MSDHDLRDVFNGARCETYSWTQSHSDIEICIALNRRVTYEQISVVATSKRISVRLHPQRPTQEVVHPNKSSDSFPLMEGEFEHQIDSSTVYWLLDNDKRPTIVLFIDKSTPLWWNRLIKDEKQLQHGRRNYAISIEHLDDGSRMIIDKLVIEQRNKMPSKEGTNDISS